MNYPYVWKITCLMPMESFKLCVKLDPVEETYVVTHKSLIPHILCSVRLVFLNLQKNLHPIR